MAEVGRIYTEAKMAPSTKGIGDYCRLCAVEAKNGVIIYSSEGLTLCLEEKITQCLRIEVSKNDMLPKKVCRPCRARLEDYHRFAERANKVQYTLELLLRDYEQVAGSSDLTTFNNAENNLEKYDKTVDLLEEYPIDARVAGLEDSVAKNTVKCEDSVLIKEEFMELPDCVSLETDSNSHLHLPDCVSLETDSNNHIHLDEHDHPCSEEENIRESPASSSKGKKVKKSPSERLVRQPKRRKTQDPKKTADTLLPKTRARQRRAAPVPSVSSAEEEPEDVEELDQVPDLEPEELEDLDIFEGIPGVAEGDLEEEDGIGDENETTLKAKEEWKTHWGIKCNECEQIFPFKSQFDKHYRQTYDKKPLYTCSYCNKSMEKYSTFRSHCYRHVTEGRYKCEYCQKGFSLRSMLHVHKLAKHTTVKPFICEECGKGFVTRPGLNIHLKKHKVADKSEFPCEECGKVLHTRGGLTAHQNVHKLGRRFMCDVCGKTFTQKVNMQQHVKHHTGERPFTCEKCGKCFAEKSHLNRHYSFHSEKRPFQCGVCSKHYKTERCLKVHAMVHAEARPYVCTYCSKGFLSTTKLKQHNNIHTGERPYACKFCERTFTNYPNWLKHTRRRHKTDPRGGLPPTRGGPGGGPGMPRGSLSNQQQHQLVVQEPVQTMTIGQAQQPSSVALIVTNATNMSMMAPYPHQHVEEMPEHRMQATDHQAGYSEHMMVMPMHVLPHHHHMLPL